MSSSSKALLSIPLLAFFLTAADPPSEVDSALRSRVQQFYQLQVDRKFREAEQIVAADTKDFYYESRKPDIQKFDISGIQYASDFLSAKVTLTSQMTIMIPGTAPRQMNIPFSSTWKVEDGKWCWYVDQSTLLDTPFGRARPKTDAAAENVANLKERISSGNLMDGVHADVTRLQLDPANPKLQTVTLKNTLPGPVSIQSITLSPGLKIAIAKPDLAADESTTVTVEPVAGEPDHPKQLLLRIGPLGQVIQIALEYPAAK